MGQSLGASQSFSAVIDADEIRARQAPRQLARDFTGPTAKIEHAVRRSHMRLREIGETTNRQKPGIGWTERIVCLPGEQGVMKSTVARRRPAPPRPVEPCNETGKWIQLYCLTARMVEVLGCPRILHPSALSFHA